MIKTVSCLAIALFLIGPSIRSVAADVGDIDPDFGSNGTVKLGNPGPYRFAIQPDGKILVAHGNTAGELVVTRYLNDGTIDPSVSNFVLSDGWSVGRVVVRPDGKILIWYEGPSTNSMVLLTASLNLYTPFGTNGKLDLGGIEDFAILPDNRLVTVSGWQMNLYSPNGALSQEVFLPYQSSKLKVRPDGRIVVMGGGGLFGYNPNFTPDMTLCNGGLCTVPISSIDSWLIAPNGGIIVAGPDGVTRLLPDGAVDTTFGNLGVLSPGTFSQMSYNRLIKVDDQQRMYFEVNWAYLGANVVRVDTAGVETFFEVRGTIFNFVSHTWQEYLANRISVKAQENGYLLAVGVQTHPWETPIQSPFWLTRLSIFDREPVANLRFGRSRVTPGSVGGGEAVEIRIQVTNDGPGRAGYVTLENPLPNGTTFVSFEAPQGWVTYKTPHLLGGIISCSGYSLTPGQTAEFRLRLRVNTNVAAGTEIKNTTTIKSLVTDLLKNNTQITSFTVQ